MSQVGESFGAEPINARQPNPGMGMAVARRTVYRESDKEDWNNVADRVAEGNLSCLKLLDNYAAIESSIAKEKAYLRNAIASMALLTSGRHLQHGDADQYTRMMEVYTNCSSAVTSYSLAYLSLCGSGVGRTYDDDMIVVDWGKAPSLWFILSSQHPDFPKCPEERMQFYMDCTGDYTEIQEIADEFFAYFVHSDMPMGEPPEGGAAYYEIDDSREGWAKSVEIVEAATHEGNESLIALNFSKIRKKGSPIGGMQNRPCSGPLSWVRAFVKLQLNAIEPRKREALAPWAAAMWADHSFAEEIVSAGARRAARMSTKSWRDPGIFDFIKIKNGSGLLWTSNNSVMVDKEFWELVHTTNVSRLALHAKKVFGAIAENSFIAGEPGIINGDKLWDRVAGLDRQLPIYFNGEGFCSSKYQTQEAKGLMAVLSSRAANTRFPTGVNPCSEIGFSVLGAFCVISDVAPLLACPVNLNSVTPDVFSLWDRRVLDSILLSVRFLIRVNLMDSVYRKEVLRTNRIGVALTGIHEWAWTRWGLGFNDLIDENKSKNFWSFIKFISDEAKKEANTYSDELGLTHPFTVTTIKPSGSVSKIPNLTEGAHLPARRQYLRWVQFRGTKDEDTWGRGADPLLSEYEGRGYPVKSLRTFQGTSIVGFPTKLLMQELNPSMVIAPEVTPEDHYQWLRLLEKYWIGPENGNQISYTLKIDTNHYTLDSYKKLIMTHQPTVKCCSILPTRPDDQLGYEYLPEQEVDIETYDAICRAIETAQQSTQVMEEEIDLMSLQCASGLCPI